MYLFVVNDVLRLPVLVLPTVDSNRMDTPLRFLVRVSVTQTDALTYTSS